MIPICRDTGSVIAFGGRSMAADQMPKYLNSENTPIYSKGRTLYGLNLSKAAIRQNGFVVLVEGYFDFAQVFRTNAAPVVASCGTALTTQQAQLLRRFTTKVVLSFDPDAAGQLQFHSLLPPEASRDKSFDQIFTPALTREGVAFHARNKLCLWTSERLACRETESSLSRLFTVGDRNYLQKKTGLMEMTGCRPQDALALRWVDIEGRVVLTKRLSDDKIKERTKNEGDRSAPLLEPLKEDLKALRERSGDGPLDQIFSIRQLGNPFRVHKRGDFDFFQARRDKQFDEFRFLLRRNRFAFVLQAVPWSHFDDADALR